MANFTPTLKYNRINKSVVSDTGTPVQTVHGLVFSYLANTAASAKFSRLPVSTNNRDWAINVFNNTLYSRKPGNTRILQKSTDGGLTWTDLYTATYSIRYVVVAEDGSILIDQDPDGDVLSNSGGAATILRSTDGGATFSLTKSFSSGGWQMWSFSVKGNVFFIAEYGAYNAPYVYKSTDSGATWSTVFTHPNNSGTIAFDAATNGTNTSSTSQTTAHTCTGNNRFLVVGVMGSTTADKITGVTYAGVAMTKAGSEQISPGDRWLSVWYLMNPASGTNNIVATSSSSDFIATSAASYTGVSQSGQPEVSLKSSQTTGDPNTNTLTTLTDNSWHIAVGGAASGTPTAGASTTRRAVNGGSNLAIFDKNAAKTPAGSDSLVMSGMSSSFGSILYGFSLAPVTGSATAHIHKIYQDPDVADLVFVSYGDNAGSRGVSYSDDNGSTWHVLTTSHQPTQIITDSDYVYLGEDLEGTISRIPKSVIIGGTYSEGTHYVTVYNAQTDARVDCENVSFYSCSRDSYDNIYFGGLGYGKASATGNTGDGLLVVTKDQGATWKILFTYGATEATRGPSNISAPNSDGWMFVKENNPDRVMVINSSFIETL